VTKFKHEIIAITDLIADTTDNASHMQESCIMWCKENIGPIGESWVIQISDRYTTYKGDNTYFRINKHPVVFAFKEETDAMAFKLRFT
jgi:hypothetical protein